MDPKTTTAIIIGSFAFVIAMLIALVGFFWKQRDEALKSSLDGLAAGFKGLAESMNASRETQIIHGERLGEHRKELDELRRVTCQNPDCPNRRRRGD